MGLEERIVIRFSADRAFGNKLDRVRALLSNRVRGLPGLEQVFDAALEAYLDKHCPRRRDDRRMRRRARVANAASVAERE